MMLAPSTWILFGALILLLPGCIGEKRAPKDWIRPLILSGLFFIPFWIVWSAVAPSINRAFGHDRPRFWRWSDTCYLQQRGQWVSVEEAQHQVNVGDICTGEGAYWQLDQYGNWQKIELGGTDAQDWR